MALRLEPIRPEFGARVSGVKITLGITDSEFSELRRALDEYSVLVFADQPMSDTQQIEFSRLWGPLEPTKGVNPASGTFFARQSNLDIATGTIISPSDRRMDYQRGNYQWHADSTFKRMPSLCSILTAREVPSEGGNTEFVSTRAAYEALTKDEQRELNSLTVEHDFSVSRGRVGFKFSPEEAALYPPVWHPLVQTNPVTGRGSLLIGAHAAAIVDWPAEKGAALLADLLDRATRPELVYSHRWQVGDVVIWDNRSVLHRATAYDSVNRRRLMQRTTISNPAVLQTPAYRQIETRRSNIVAS
jgi:alpha-ketoglutarate-dependent 2,4-dichlorophenoxyacetate dioxygenase